MHTSALKKMLLKAIAVLVSAAAIFSCSACFADDFSEGMLSVYTASAASQTGIVTADSLRVRSNAGTTYSTIGYVYEGNTIEILGSANDIYGGLWYKINYGGRTGYVSAEYVEVKTQPAASTPYTPDGDFEKYLTSQGFPESYKVKLRQIHQAHPKWVFKAQDLGVDWNTALKAESQVGVSLTYINNPDSWKSMEKGAYNWSSGSWYGLDGWSWVAASEQIIAYYMDPRNFLDDTYVFMFEQLSYDTNVHTEQGVKDILADTFMKGSYTTPDTKVTKTYSSTIMEAAAQTGVSPYHLASRIRQEMGVNGTELAFGTVAGYGGYFNFFNIQAYATSTLTARQMGAKYASTTNSAYSLPWTNQYKAIVGGSKFIGTSYINRGQDTLYLQKFDMVDGGNGYFAHQYMTNIQAAASEAASMKRAYNDRILSSALVFTIPVYKNMPENACAQPSSYGNNNNFLSSLSVKGYSFTPAFNMYTQSYSLTVPANVSSVNISAAAKTSAATVSGVGNVNLKTGDNAVTVAVKAPSGAVRNYVINIKRQGSAAAFTYGDVNDDGFIDTDDSLLILQYAAGNLKLTKDQLSAADVTDDGIADIDDALKILQYTAGTIPSVR